MPPQLMAPLDPPKSTPDLQKINDMTSPVLQVTKHTQRTGPGQLIIQERNASKDRILDLSKALLVEFGPGTYKCEVSDEGGPQKDSWTFRLAAPGAVPAPNGFPFTDTGEPADGSEYQEVAPGWFYNAEIGALFHRNLPKPLKWAPGTPLPTSALPAAVAATPLGSSLPGLGGLGEDPRVEVLKEQLRGLSETRKDEQRQREMHDLRSSFEKSLEQMNSRFMTVLERLEKRPGDGESDRIKELERKLELQQAEQRHQAELRALQDKIESTARELRESAAANRGPDPMVTLLTTMLTNVQASAAEMVKALQSSQQNSAAETRAWMERFSSTALTPERFLELTKQITAQSKGAGDDITRGYVDMFKDLFSMSREVLKLREEAGGEGPPPWMALAQQGLGAVTRIAGAMAARQPAPTPMFRPQMMAPPRPRPIMPGAPVAGPPAAAPAPAGPPSGANLRAKLADEKFGRPSGSRSARDAVAEQVYPKGAEANGAAPASGQSPTDTAPASEGGKPRGRRSQKNKNAPAPAAAAPLPQPTTADDDGDDDEGGDEEISPAEMAKMPVEEVWNIAAGYTDEDFFGSNNMPFIEEFRAAVVAGTYDPGAAAQEVLMAVPHLRGSEVVPPALEILEAGHIAIVVQRLLPAAPPEYLAAMTASMVTAIAGASAEAA